MNSWGESSCLHAVQRRAGPWLLLLAVLPACADDSIKQASTVTFPVGASTTSQANATLPGTTGLGTTSTSSASSSSSISSSPTPATSQSTTGTSSSAQTDSTSSSDQSSSDSTSSSDQSSSDTDSTSASDQSSSDTDTTSSSDQSSTDSDPTSTSDQSSSDTDSTSSSESTTSSQSSEDPSSSESGTDSATQSSESTSQETDTGTDAAAAAGQRACDAFAGVAPTSVTIAKTPEEAANLDPIVPSDETPYRLSLPSEGAGYVQMRIPAAKTILQMTMSRGTHYRLLPINGDGSGDFIPEISPTPVEVTQVIPECPASPLRTTHRLFQSEATVTIEFSGESPRVIWMMNATSPKSEAELAG